MGAQAPTPTRRSESEAVFAALSAGAGGAVSGLELAGATPTLSLAGSVDSLAPWAALAAGTAPAAATGIADGRIRAVRDE